MENDSGKEILLGTRGAFCRKTDRKDVKKYYKDMNHYNITDLESYANFTDLELEHERWVMPAVIANWLNEAMDQEAEQVDWPTDKYGRPKDVTWASFYIVSKDELLKGSLSIVKHDGKYYLHERHSDKSNKTSGSKKIKIISKYIEIPDHVAAVMQPYLDEE